MTELVEAALQVHFLNLERALSIRKTAGCDTTIT